MKTCTEAQLVEFGNYLLSDKRKEMVKEEHSQMVHHSDLENWKEIKHPSPCPLQHG